VESIFDHYVFSESLELLKKCIDYLVERISSTKNEALKKQSNLFENTSNNSENIPNQLENWQINLDSHNFLSLIFLN